MYLARWCSLRRVTSAPSIMILPSSTGQTPATAFSMVDLPAPLPPMTVTKSPSFRWRDRPFRAVFSLTVPGLKVLYMFWMSSMGLFLLLGLGAAEVFLVQTVRRAFQFRGSASRNRLRLGQGGAAALLQGLFGDGL